mgnify:CR=1 FL=1
MNENADTKLAQLTADLAAMIEKSGINYLGAITALRRLLEHYEKEGAVFLNTANIRNVVLRRHNPTIDPK